MQRRLLAVIVAIVALGSSLAAGIQTPPKRVAFMSIHLPPEAKATRPVSTASPEGGMATVGIPDVGQFGFTPAFPKNDNATVVVTITDLSTKPGRELGSVSVTVGGKPVQSKTQPSFAIEVTRVTQPK